MYYLICEVYIHKVLISNCDCLLRQKDFNVYKWGWAEFKPCNILHIMAGPLETKIWQLWNMHHFAPRLARCSSLSLPLSSLQFYLFWSPTTLVCCDVDSYFWGCVGSTTSYSSFPRVSVFELTVKDITELEIYMTQWLRGLLL